MIVRGSFNHRIPPLCICRGGSYTPAYNSQHRPTTSHRCETADILASAFRPRMDPWSPAWADAFMIGESRPLPSVRRTCAPQLWPFATQEQSNTVLTNTASISPGDLGFASQASTSRFFIANGVVPQDPLGAGQIAHSQ
jgi:hypothetical protein